MKFKDWLKENEVAIDRIYNGYPTGLEVLLKDAYESGEVAGYSDGRADHAYNTECNVI